MRICSSIRRARERPRAAIDGFEGIFIGMIVSASNLSDLCVGGPQGQGMLSGRKRALLCGCNYAGSSAALNGRLTSHIGS